MRCEATRSFLLLPLWDAGPPQGHPPVLDYLLVPICTPGRRLRHYESFAQEHNAVPRPGLAVPLKSKLPPLVLFLARRESCLERRESRPARTN